MWLSRGGIKFKRNFIMPVSPPPLPHTHTPTEVQPHPDCQQEIIPGTLNSAKFRGGCRGPAKIRQRGVAIIFFTFYAIKLSLFRVSTLSH